MLVLVARMGRVCRYSITTQIQRTQISRCAVGNEDVAETPHGLDKARAARVRLDQLAQPGNLDIETAVEDFVFTAACQFHQLFTRQRCTRMTRSEERRV